jgi:hypothetical protein
MTQAEAYSRYRIRVSQLGIQHSRIIGKVRNYSSHGYAEIAMLVHIYDKEGSRILRQDVVVKQVLPDDTVRIDEPLKVDVESISADLSTASKCEVKAMLVK